MKDAYGISRCVLRGIAKCAKIGSKIAFSKEAKILSCLSNLLLLLILLLIL